MTTDSADVAIEVRGLTKRFGPVQAVDGAEQVSVVVRQS